MRIHDLVLLLLSLLSTFAFALILVLCAVDGYLLLVQFIFFSFHCGVLVGVGALIQNFGQQPRLEPNPHLFRFEQWTDLSLDKIWVIYQIHQNIYHTSHRLQAVDASTAAIQCLKYAVQQMFNKLVFWF